VCALVVQIKDLMPESTKQIFLPYCIETVIEWGPVTMAWFITSIGMFQQVRHLGRPPIWIYTYLLIYLIHGEKLTGSQLVKKFPTFCETRRFITAFTRARDLSLFWARSIQIMPHSTSWRSILILLSHLRLDRLVNSAYRNKYCLLRHSHIT
jgi:hypothetical protein